jgi:hypothetical protein
MQMKIQIKGLPRAAQLRRVAAQKIDVALGSHAHAIQEASVHLDDINGPERGGVDKLCRVVLKMKDSSVLVIEELGTDIVRVIERVADRLRQGVARQISRTIGFDRNRVRPPQAAGAL